MAKLTKIQQAQFDSLTAQVAELTTQVGVLMNSLEVSNQKRSELQDERDALIVENEQLITILSQQTQPPAPVVKSAPKLTVSASVVEFAPSIEITAEDRRIWSAFKALPREKRQSYYDFARKVVGHLGIHNIVAVREAYLAQQAA